MRRVPLFLILAVTLLVQAASASAQTARAPRYKDVKKLGGATSFYKQRPLTDAASLKAMADTKGMEADIRTVLREGGVADAAAVAADAVSVMRRQLEPRRGGSCSVENAREGELVECTFPVGGTMPFMAYRSGGAPHALKNFRWAGDAPFDAFMFRVYSRGKSYMVIVPKSCGNFSVLAQPNAAPIVTKLATPEKFTAGSPVGFTLTVRNEAPNGGAIARDVRLTDTLPTSGGLNWAPLGADAAGCTLSGNALTCAWPSLAPSDWKTVKVVSTSTTPYSACQAQQNTVRVTSENGAPVQDSATATCIPPVLELTKGPKNGTFTIGSTATFTMTVKNAAVAGGSSASNVVLTDTLPTAGGLDWQAAATSKGSCDAVANGALRCSVGTLAPQESATITVNSRPAPIAACQAQPNTARVNASGELSASDSATLGCTPPKLVVDKTPDGGIFKQGDQVSFTIVVKNDVPAGASPATSVKLADTLPTNGGLNWAEATTTAGSCALSGDRKGTLACDLGTIAAGQSVTVKVSSPAKTPMGACQAQPNTASATADGGLTAQDAGSLSCSRSFWFFGDAFGGKDRRVRPVAGTERLDGLTPTSNAGAGLDFAQCSPLVGVNIGIAKELKNSWELAATAGMAMSVVQAGHKVREHEATLDVEANKYLKSGVFVGTGVSMWDLFHSDTFEPALLTHFGVPLGTHPTHPIYFVGEGRLFFRQMNDIANNYQFWGGVRVRF